MDEPFVLEAAGDEAKLRRPSQSGKEKTNEQNNETSVHSLEHIVPPTDSDEEYDELPGLQKNKPFLLPLKKSENGKRMYDKAQYCIYCRKPNIKLARHLELKHSEERDVARFLSMPKKSHKRKIQLEHIRKAGNFYHNMLVLETGNGELVLVRRPNENENVSKSIRDYGPCPECLGFMQKRLLWHHYEKCIGRKPGETEESSSEKRKQLKSASACMVLAATCKESESQFRKSILAQMKEDDTAECVLNDQLIIKIGLLQYEKYGLSQTEMIRQNMRMLARLLIQIRSNFPGHSLQFFIHPDRFDRLITGVSELTNKTMDSCGKQVFSLSSLALKLGYLLKKCSNILRGQAIRNQNIETERSCKAFLDLYELEWTTRISSRALASLHESKQNKPIILPLTSDLVKLAKYQEMTIKHLSEELDVDPCKETWSKLAEVTLSRIVLFNKRRSGEACKILVTQYLSDPDWSKESTQELQATLTPLEKHLCNCLKLIQVRGKCGTNVAVLITAEVKIAIDILIKCRVTVGVPETNVYVFANANSSSDRPIRGCDALRNVLSKVQDLENPDVIRSTLLRKYIATVSQVFNLSNTELDWLARHLGHDIRVHREFYRLHTSAIELAKVSRVLLAVDQGKVSQFAGKGLEDINVEDMEFQEETAALDTRTDVHQDTMNSPADSEEDQASAVSAQVVTQVQTHGKRKRNHSDSEESTLGDQKKKVKHTPWSKEEKTCVLQYFNTLIKKRVVPGKIDCEKCLSQFPIILVNCSWKNVKDCVHNYNNKIKNVKAKN